VLKALAMRLTLATFCFAISFSVYAIADDAKHVVDVPAGDLAVALGIFAKQSGTDLIYRPEQVKGLQTRGVHGEFTAHDAVQLLIQGSSLILKTDANGAMLIIVPDAEVPTAHPTSSTQGSGPGSADPQEGSSASSFRVAQTAPGAAAATPQVVATTQQPVLQEVIVTAQKREERLQDVPVPVTALNAQELAVNNELRVQDYYTQIPGLTASLNNSGAANLAIRGITTGDGANPTVGIVVDDVPYGSSTVLGSGAAVPDIDPGELARVEVLRGPQGTLYGASSLGGLLKFVTLDPSTDGLSGRVQGGVSSVFNGNELGYSLRGALNAPLGDTVAIRVSGFTRRDPGYIDNVQTGENGVNRGDADGGRLSLLWRPSEDFSLKLGVLSQDNRTYGSPNVMTGPGLGDLEQQALRWTGGYYNKIEAYSAHATLKVGSVALTSVTGYNVNDTFLPQDLSSFFGDLTQQMFGVDGTVTLFEADTRKFSQEFRLAMPIGPRFDWLLGVFYTHEKSSVVSPIVAVNSADGAQAGVWLESDAPSTYTEYAAFTDLTVHFTERFDLQLGGRESRDEQSYYQVQSGPYVTMFLGVPSPFTQGPINTTENAFTYLITPSFKLSSDFMLYARLASGYRPGGPNVGGVVFHAPLSYAPDKTQNYEMGLKGDLLRHKLSLDASLYRIDWKDIQIVAFDPTTGASYQVNGSRAKSDGLELSVNAMPLSGLTVSSWISWGLAKLTEPFPSSSSVYGNPGDRLPYSTRFSGRLSLQQDFPLTAATTGFVGASVSYVGDRFGEFASAFGPPQRQYYPSYAQTDLRAGAHFNDWLVNLYCNNVTDKRGVLNGGLNFFPPNAFNYIQPRTIGLSIVRTF
jgi:iron complex outermembrane recepter protein